MSVSKHMVIGVNSGKKIIRIREREREVRRVRKVILLESEI